VHMYLRSVSGGLGMRFLAAFLVSLVMVGGLDAQDARKHKFEVFAQFGGAFYTSVTRDFVLPTIPPTQLREERTFASTGRFSTGFRWGLTDKDAVEVSYSYSPGRVNEFTTGSPLIWPGPSVTAFRAHHLSFNYVRAFEPTGRVQPFLTGGAGFTVFETPFQTGTRPAGNLGIGMDLRLADKWLFRLEQRTVISGAPRGTNAVWEGTFLQFLPSAGLVFRF
jgi:hypothetical protein